jgi:BRCA1-associated protein
MMADLANCQVGVSEPSQPRVCVGKSEGHDLLSQLVELPVRSWQLLRERRLCAVLDATTATVRSTLVLVANVPSHVGKRQLRFFFGELASTIRDIWLLRDGAPHRYSVLLSACCPTHGETIRRRLHGVRFSPVDVEVAIVLPISTVHYVGGAAGSGSILQPSALPEPLPLLPKGWGAHLPTCAVCLTRLEPSVTGAVTRACTHASHCMCLAQSCSAGCRVCQIVEHARRNAATALASPVRDPGSGVATGRDEMALPACAACAERQGLWLCLVCGTLGCGRYASMHAHAHYLHTGHSLALDLSTQRVWDYESDRFVHRLMAMAADEADDELFELELPDGALGGAAAGDGGVATDADDGPRAAAAAAAATAAADSGAKLDGVLREYSLLLTGQLDAQRAFLEEQAAAQAEATAAELRGARQGLADALASIRAREQAAARLARTTQRRDASASRRADEITTERRFVRELNGQLIANTRELRARGGLMRADAEAAEASLQAARSELDAALAMLTL